MKEGLLETDCPVRVRVAPARDPASVQDRQREGFAGAGGWLREPLPPAEVALVEVRGAEAVVVEAIEPAVMDLGQRRLREVPDPKPGRDEVGA